MTKDYEKEVYVREKKNEIEIVQSFNVQMENKLFEVVEWLANFYNKNNLSQLSREKRYMRIRNELAKKFVQKPMTNLEKIRQMSDEELSDFIFKNFANPCRLCRENVKDHTYCSSQKTCCDSIKAWLNSEVEE